MSNVGPHRIKGGQSPLSQTAVPTAWSPPLNAGSEERNVINALEIALRYEDEPALRQLFAASAESTRPC